MLKCKEVAERASRLIDDELGPWQKLNMRLHLMMCSGCRAFVQQFRVTQALLRSAEMPSTEETDAEMAAIFARTGRGDAKSEDSKI